MESGDKLGLEPEAVKFSTFCQHRSCRPVCSFHLGLLLASQQNVLKGEIRKIIFIPSIPGLGWFLLCCKTIALCNLSFLRPRGAKCPPSRVCSTPRSCAVAPPKQAKRLQPGHSWGRKIRFLPDGKSSWSSCSEVWQKKLQEEEKVRIIWLHPSFNWPHLGWVEQARTQLTALRKPCCLPHLFWRDFFGSLLSQWLGLCEKDQKSQFWLEYRDLYLLPVRERRWLWSLICILLQNKGVF